MASLAFNFFRSSRPSPVQPPELVAADAAALRDMSLEIPRKWRMLDALTAELGQIAGVPTIVKRPEQQFFPIAAELAGGELRDAISAELTDLIDLLEPAVEVFSQAPRLSQGDLNMVHNLLEQVTAVRMRMLAAIPPAEA
ncbi:hypothetical protein [Novosphingobium ginsenosidimutans]|uniref:Uncharacterized protein n=1 Tax=Novosphingobium ginsenosidimutans TaxID=1176536 RepID=A0A5B8S0C6_9SPHN|nr:hypothetical protein [Novosphingobium ginsenosidimutans]QEA14833.1 hypothetical protein FRF71_01080 [Novosphingobium ginsenosidimutans]